MARLGAKVSWSEVSFILKNTFSVGIFLWNRPHASFLGLIGYLVRSGAKLFRTKTLLNFASKALSNSFCKKQVFGLNFSTKSHLTYFLGQTDWMARLGGKVSRSEVSSIQKNTVLDGIFLTKPVPYPFSTPNWLYGAFGGKIVPNENFAQFCLKSPLEFVFPKITFSVWIFVLNRTSPIFLA